MRYVMKEKLFSFTDSFVIRDENGNDVFQVRAKLLSFGKKLSFRSMDGEEVAAINQKLLSFKPTYEIERDGKTVATVSKDFFTILRHRFTVDVPGPDDLEAAGSFLEHEYTFTRHDAKVATVSKHWFSVTDTYGVEVGPGEDAVLILASAVVIDMVCHEKE